MTTLKPKPTPAPKARIGIIEATKPHTLLGKVLVTGDGRMWLITAVSNQDYRFAEANMRETPRTRQQWEQWQHKKYQPELRKVNCLLLQNALRNGLIEEA